MLEVFFIIVGLIAIASLVYTYVFIFKHWKLVKTVWAKIALILGFAYLVMVFLSVMINA